MSPQADELGAREGLLTAVWQRVESAVYPSHKHAQNRPRNLNKEDRFWKSSNLLEDLETTAKWMKSSHQTF